MPANDDDIQVPCDLSLRKYHLNGRRRRLRNRGVPLHERRRLQCAPRDMEMLTPLNGIGLLTGGYGEEQEGNS